MKHERHSYWDEWRCDLDGCKALATTHRILVESGEEAETPPGWVRIDPPRYWKGSSLAFCGSEHAQEFIGRTVIIRPQLAAVNG